MNRITRTWLVGLLSLTLAAGVLAGCSSSPSPTPVAPAATVAAPAQPAAPAASTPATTPTPPAAQPTQPAATPAAATPATPAPATPAPATPAPAPAPAAPAPVSPWPMTVKDDEGRSVTIAAQPKRILSLAPSNTEILFALGLGDKVVGVDDFSDYPAEAATKQKVGGLYNPNVEVMVSLQPDLVLAIGGSAKQWQKLADQGVPVVVIQPTSIAQVLDSIRFVGKLVGAQAGAAAVTATMQARIDYIQEQVTRVHSYTPTAFYEVWNDPIYTVGPGSFVDDMIRIAGGQNVFHGAPIAWPVVTLEAVLAANPEVIISSDADWVGNLKAGKFAAWNGIKGVTSGTIFVVDATLATRPGPRITEGLWQIARAVNPLLFGQ